MIVFFFPLIHREEVIVFKTVSKKTKLAKAAYLGPKDISDINGNEISFKLFTFKYFLYIVDTCFY